ncbi:hypothetical protein G9A89_005704 [Geosiphon pyriformis]|nr:hypothetical protein G9A89_005704 [Geosiphon pyriformis]
MIIIFSGPSTFGKEVMLEKINKSIKNEFVGWEESVKYPSKIFKFTRVNNKRNIKASKAKGEDTATKGSFMGSFGVSKKEGIESFAERVIRSLEIYWPAVKE